MHFRHIFDAENLNTVCQITAHDSVLAAVRFNPEGNKLATGSEKVILYIVCIFCLFAYSRNPAPGYALVILLDNPD